MESGEWLKIKEAAPKLKMSTQALYAAVRENQLPQEAVLKIGKRIRINLAELRAQDAATSTGPHR